MRFSFGEPLDDDFSSHFSVLNSGDRHPKCYEVMVFMVLRVIRLYSLDPDRLDICLYNWYIYIYIIYIYY